MVVDVVDDAFRFVWFFLLSFAGYIFGGRVYGVQLSVMIYAIVFALYFFVELYLSWYVLLTFVASFFAFNIFMVYFLLKINIDVETLQKRIESEVQKRQTNEQILLRKYRMANMGEMIDAIAHQWRQPLARANMILINIDEERGNQKYIDKKVEELMGLNEHMSQTIDDFRYLLHESKMVSDFDVDMAINDVLILMKNQLAGVEVKYTSKPIELYGYKNELIQLLIILLANAVEALEAKKVKEKKIWIEVKREESTFTLRIADNAGGIDVSMIDKIFDPYVTSKKSTGGTGLGLYIAKLMVEGTMQGSIIVENTGDGAVFIVVLSEPI